MWWITFRQKKQRPGIRPINRLGQARLPRNKQGGQVGIETTVAIVAITVFLLGVTQLFLWMNRSMIKRQNAYQESRIQLGTGTSSINFYDAKSLENRLYVFPQER